MGREANLGFVLAELTGDWGSIDVHFVKVVLNVHKRGNNLVGLLYLFAPYARGKSCSSHPQIVLKSVFI